MVFRLIGLLPSPDAFMLQFELTEHLHSSGTRCKYHSDMGDKWVLHKLTTNNHTSFISYLITEQINCANLLKKENVSRQQRRCWRSSTGNNNKHQKWNNTSASGNKTSFTVKDLSTFFGLKMLLVWNGSLLRWDFWRRGSYCFIL